MRQLIALSKICGECNQKIKNPKSRYQKYCNDCHKKHMEKKNEHTV